MKVLWFSLSPCGSMRRDNTTRVIQGWMISLEDAIKYQKGIELEVAFFSDKEEEPFIYEGVKYYPMYVSKSKGFVSKIIETYRSMTNYDRQSQKVMLDVVRQSKPDLIHIHGTEQCFGLINEEVKDIPVCYSLQGLLAPISERFFSGYTEAQINDYLGLYAKLRKTTATDDYKQIREKGDREVKFLKNAKYILGRTCWDKSICSLLNPNAKYFVVNEVLRKPFYTARWEKKEFGTPLRLLSVLSPGQIYKGYETLLKAASLLKTHCGNGFEWNVVGYSENNWLADLGHKLCGLKSKDCNINLCGIVTAEDLALMLTESDIYVQTSHIENSPNSLCEAMLVGTPIIATNVGGTATMLQGYGTLIPDGDPYFMAASIKNVYENFGLAVKNSMCGRELAFERHNEDVIVENLINTYNIIKDDSKNCK